MNFCYIFIRNLTWKLRITYITKAIYIIYIFYTTWKLKEIYIYFLSPLICWLYTGSYTLPVWNTHHIHLHIVFWISLLQNDHFSPHSVQYFSFHKHSFYTSPFHYPQITLRYVSALKSKHVTCSSISPAPHTFRAVLSLPFNYIEHYV